MSERGAYEFSGGFDRLIPKIVLPVSTPKPAPGYEPPTCVEASHGTHEACEHVWEWLGQAARDKDALLKALEAMLLEWDEPTLACDEARAAIAQAKGETK